MRTQKKTQKNAKKNENAKKKPKRKRMQNKRRGIISRTKKQKKKKTKTKTQILGERCKLSGGEYCTLYIHTWQYQHIMQVISFCIFDFFSKVIFKQTQVQIVKNFDRICMVPKVHCTFWEKDNVKLSIC